MSRRGMIVSCALAVVLAAAVHAVAAQLPSPRGLVGFGGYCSHTADCNAPHSACKNMSCTCESGYEVNGTTCTIKLNSNCNATHICNRTGAHCINHVCICRFDYVLSANYQNCLPVATSLNQACEVQAQCREFINSTCSSGVCQCIPGHHYNASHRSCERLGVETIQPTDVKQQPTNFPVRNDRPARHKGIGANCSNDANCTNTTNSVCRNGKCVCADGYEINGTICVIKINSSCTNDLSCNRNGTRCNTVTKKCECNSLSYVQSNNGENCLKVATIPYSDPCTEQQQCSKIGNTTCAYGTCICNNGFFLNNARSKCETSLCRQGLCDYMGYAICSQGQCRCNQGGVTDGRSCFKQIGKIDGKCDTSKYERCYLSEDGFHQHIECKKGKCACEKSYKPNKAKTRCVTGASFAVIPPSIFVLITVVATLLK